MEGIMQAVPAQIVRRIPAIGTSAQLSMIDSMRKLAEMANREPGKLTGVDCPECLNRGLFYRVADDGRRYVEECACMSKRRSLERIERSGLSDLLRHYTMETWKNVEPWHRKAREMAERYAENSEGWFYAAGNPGTGKTHLCTALCGMLIEKGFNVRYMLWRDISVRVKSRVNDDEAYREIVNPLKTVKVLYIDDLFKSGGNPRDADINFAFELLNFRYNDRNLLTIISSEKNVQDLMQIDEAVGSRIYERSKDYYLDLSRMKNWRMH